MEKTYYLTIYKSDGENVLNESFNAKNDEEAKEIGMKMLKENNSLDRHIDSFHLMDVFYYFIVKK